MNKPQKTGLVPALRFPKFRDEGEWENKPIGAVFSETLRPIDMEDDENYSLVTVKRRYGGVVSRGVFKGGAIKVKSQFLLKENDFLISKRQIVHCACGLVPSELEGSIVSNEYSILRAKEKNDVVFLNYFAQQPRVSQSFLECSIGIVIEKMLFKLNDWVKQEFPFPLYEEQQKIADCLTSIDDLITAETQKLVALKTHKKGLMQQLFPAAGETVPRLRFPEFRDAGEWDETKLGELCLGISSGKDKGDSEGKVDLYGSTGIIGKSTTYSYDGNYLLVARVGANAGLITKATGKFSVTDNTLVIDLKHPSQIHFIYYTLLKFDLNRLVFGSGQPLVTGKQLKELLLYLPKLKEQQKIADCLSSVDALIAAQGEKIEALKLHKKGLMQQLFPVMEEVEV